MPRVAKRLRVQLIPISQGREQASHPECPENLIRVDLLSRKSVSPVATAVVRTPEGERTVTVIRSGHIFYSDLYEGTSAPMTYTFDTTAGVLTFDHDEYTTQARASWMPDSSFDEPETLASFLKSRCVLWDGKLLAMTYGPPSLTIEIEDDEKPRCTLRLCADSDSLSTEPRFGLHQLDEALDALNKIESAYGEGSTAVDVLDLQVHTNETDHLVINAFGLPAKQDRDTPGHEAASIRDAATGKSVGVAEFPGQAFSTLCNHLDAKGWIRDASGDCFSRKISPMSEIRVAVSRHSLMGHVYAFEAMVMAVYPVADYACLVERIVLNTPDSLSALLELLDETHTE